METIETGRAVGASEALSMGLANRVVPKGQARDESLKLVETIASFPQHCMNLDRESCWYAAHEATSLQDALAYEYSNGIEVVEAEGIAGASRFRGGKGRYGTL
ncbi:hypothetical protein BJ170DRAFT_619817 [Xylariales sp. AK1849]|nr:hypothetical protein BJ170DRAFT_619817 [Xylariales sp. AK1849]